VLLEEVGYDARGNPLAVTYKDYLLPAISDVPVFEFLHANTPSKTVGGMRGVGEGGAIIGPPTLVNAIADALSPFGEVPLDLPLTPSKILGVIEGRPIAPVRASPPPTGEAETESAPVPTTEEPGLSAALAGVDPTTMEAAAHPAQVDGAWKMTMFPPIGSPQEMTGHFTTEGEILKGRLDSDQGSMDFEGTVSGSHLRWEMKVTKPMPVTLKYNIEVDGDRLAGKVKMGMFGTAKLTGERV
jgi:carbon-monoxide dehydrogenase large subunit